MCPSYRTILPLSASCRYHQWTLHLLRRLTSVSLICDLTVWEINRAFVCEEKWKHSEVCGWVKKVSSCVMLVTFLGIFPHPWGYWACLHFTHHVLQWRNLADKTRQDKQRTTMTRVLAVERTSGTPTQSEKDVDVRCRRIWTWQHLEDKTQRQGCLTSESDLVPEQEVRQWCFASQKSTRYI